ncbi:MAG TPA: kynureninase [Flavisolibacter sp.]|nr:kynureninase [Flavisolibacter sp.]
MRYENTIEFAKELDRRDPLKGFRQRFHIPRHNGSDSIYFTGNSLGLQPKSARAYVEREMEAWEKYAVEGHFRPGNPWTSFHEKFSHQLGRIVGAMPEEVVVMGQLTVNLHLLLTSFYRPDKKKFRIICEAMAFPSDQYALESQVRLHGFDPSEAIVEVAPADGEAVIRTEDILSTIDHFKDEVALVLFGGINYYSGQVFDMKKITAAAHKAGAYAGFDLAHAVGNIELHLHDWDVDFACWCSYKYLNSSPGGIAGLYINKKHAGNAAIPRLAGWWGYEKETRFQMKPGFRPIPTAEGWQLSNAPILLLAAHQASVDLFEEAGMPALIEKSRLLTGYLFFLLEDINNQQPQKLIRVLTPSQEGTHGCQVSMFMLDKGRQIHDALTANGVVTDWREPNVIRVAPVPMYNTFEDVWTFGAIIRKILST